MHLGKGVKRVKVECHYVATFDIAEELSVLGCDEYIAAIVDKDRLYIDYRDGGDEIGFKEMCAGTISGCLPDGQKFKILETEMEGE